MIATAPLPPRRVGAVLPALLAAPTGARRLAARAGRALVLGVAALLAAGCGGGGGGDARRLTAVHAQGRVAFGALGGATLEVYRLGDYAAPVATTTTSTGATAEETGTFSFSLPEVSPDAMFLLVATGGAAYDADEDGVLDGPTANHGRVHALARAADLDAQPIRMSAVTEVVYQRVRYFLSAGYDDAYLARACDAWASFVLGTSLYLRVIGAGVPAVPAVGNRDALAFDPRNMSWATITPWAPHYSDFVTAVLGGEPPTEKAFDLSRETLHFERLDGPSWGVALAGDHAILCRGAAGLDVWDVSDPTAPERVGRYDTPGFAANVQVVGSLAYVADGTGGLQILDVSVPSAPALVRAVPTAAPVDGVHVAGGRAYLSSDASSPALFVVDVSTPAAASVLSATPTAGAPSTVRVEGDFAYLMETDQIETIDVSDPLQPVSKGTVPADRYGRMDLGSGHLFVGSATRLEVFSLATPASPQPIASLPLPGYQTYGLRAHGDRVFLARSFDGLAVVDVADPAAPSYVGQIPSSGSALDVDVDGSLAVVSESNGGLVTVAAGTPAPSGVVASVPLGSVADAVEAVPGRACVTTRGPNRLVVFDLGDPVAPYEAGSVALATGTGADLVLDDALVYVAESGGLEIYDATNPDSPAWAGGVGTGSGLQALAARSAVVYGGSEDDVSVFEASPPAGAALLATRSLNGLVRRLAVAENVLVVAAGNGGLFTYDVTTAGSPTAAGALPMLGANDVTLRLPYAFVTQLLDSGLECSLRVVDGSALGQPAVVRSVGLPGLVDRVARSGDRVYVSAGVGGIHVVDAARPDAAYHTGTIPVPAAVSDLSVAQGYVYATTSSPAGSLLVLRAGEAEVP